MASKLPKDWRELRDYPRRARFYVERSEDGWFTIDAAYGTCLAHDTREAAECCRGFAKEYAKVHGDIDFNAFPYSIEQAFEYDVPSEIDAWWTEQRDRHMKGRNP